MIEEQEQDPQDTAELSADMAEPEVVQVEVKVGSVYSGLVEIAKTCGKLYRTNGRRADMMKFDLTSHSVFVGNAFIVHHGRLRMPVLETASTKVDLTGLPWLTPKEQKLDPVKLFAEHYMSRPNGAEKYMSSNFPAIDIDEMSDDEISRGMPRGEARVRLEAWMLCAGIDGTLERYVTSQPGWRDGSWWWCPCPSGQADTQLVVKTEWWQKEAPMPTLTPRLAQPGYLIQNASGQSIAEVYGADPAVARAMQVATQLARAAQTLAGEALKLEMRAKCFDIDPTVSEVNRLVEYINTGRMRQAWYASASGDAGNKAR